MVRGARRPLGQVGWRRRERPRDGLALGPRRAARRRPGRSAPGLGVRCVRSTTPGFASFLLRRGIAGELEVDEAERLGPAAFAPVRWAQAFRALAGRSIQSSFPPREAGLLMGLALGDDSHLDPGLERDFRATGLSHLLVVSGENVAMVLAPIVALGAALGWSRWPRFALGMGTVAFFVVLTGAEPSVMRAGVMAGLALIGVLLGRPRSTGSILAGAVVVLLVLDPALVWSVGFQLSVAATASMVALATPISTRLRFLPSALALATGATLAAQVGVTPLLLFYFHEVPVSTVAANVLAFPAVAPALLLGLAAATIGIVVPAAGHLDLDPRAGADALPADRRRPSRPSADPVDHGRRRAHADPRSGARGPARLVVARRTAPAKARVRRHPRGAPAAGVDERDLGRSAERAHGPVLRRRAGRLGAAHLAGRASRSWSTAAPTPPRSRPSSRRSGSSGSTWSWRATRTPTTSWGSRRCSRGSPSACCSSRDAVTTRRTGPRSTRPPRASTSTFGTRERATCSRSATSASRSCRPTAAGPGRSPTRTTTRSSSAQASGRTRSCSRPSPRSRRSRCCSTRAWICTLTSSRFRTTAPRRRSNRSSRPSTRRWPS